MKDMGKVVVVAVALLVAVGCGQTPPPDEPAEPRASAEPVVVTSELDGTSWLAESITGEPSAEGVTSTVAFAADGKVAGNAGCNYFFGSFGVDGDNIAFGHMGATQKMCIDEANMIQEGRFLEALGQAERYAIEGGVLVIYSTGYGDPSRLVPAPSAGVVTGSVFYRERIALPPDATVTVKLVDVSRQDVEAVVLAEQEIVAEGRNVPFDFELEYDPAQIDDRMSYAVQARIESGGELMFTTTEHIPVITRDGPTEDVQVLVQRVQ